METIRDILMNSTDDDLSVLAGYSIDMNEKEINTCNDQTKRYLYVNQLVASFQNMGRTFFYAKLEYSELIRKLAESMEVTMDKKSPSGIDVIELAIGKKYIIKSLPNIPVEKRAELLEIIGIANSEAHIDDKNVITRLSGDLPDRMTFRLLTWLASCTLQSFLGNIPEWESTGIVFCGKKEFRQHVIYPILYMTMLRHKYRYQQVPKCSVCMTLLVPEAKFCNECGTKV